MKYRKLILGLSCAGLFLLFAACQNQKKKQNQKEQKTEPVVRYEFGIPIDSFELSQGKFQSGETLSSVLDELGASSTELAEVAMVPESILNVKAIKAGNNYSAYLTNDSLSQLAYFIYHKSLVDYAVLDFRDSTKIKYYDGSRPTRVEHKCAKAVIESSLWNAVNDSNLNMQLALDISDIYSWTIDFFGLQKNDEFSACYDKVYVDSIPFGIDSIHAVKFRHAGQDYYAFYFHKGDVEGYFDTAGVSVKKAFLKAPLHYSRISSRFTYARRHPVLRIVRPHTGVDYAAPRGTPVESIGDGVVIQKGYHGGGGNTVKIRHNATYTTGYLHLSRYGKDIQVGTHVSQGQVIGYVGSTGASTGPHLDFRVWRDGKPVDPLKLKSPSGKPIPKKYHAEFDSIVSFWNRQLN